VDATSRLPKGERGALQLTSTMRPDAHVSTRAGGGAPRRSRGRNAVCMTTIAELVSSAGGLLHKRDLVAHGATDRHLTAAVRSRSVTRPRRGWYSTWDRGDPRYVAVAIGGRLTGASALWQAGAWSWTRPPITVSVPETASRLRRRRGVRIVWDPAELSERGTTWSVDPRDALARAVVEARSLEDAVILVDWARHVGVLHDDDDAAEVLSRKRADAAGLVAWTGGGAESILESAAGTRLRCAGHQVQRQVPVAGTHLIIDMIVDGVIGLETDGRQHHERRFDADRLKDAAIARGGHVPFRAGTVMVRQAWESTAAAIDALIAMAGGPRPVVGADNSCLPRVLGPRGRRHWRLAVRRRRKEEELPTG
jgi:very-short-patch-repair endonuclease